MDTQIILACDENGKILEYIPKSVGHTGEGKKHLAITVLIYNKNNEILLQRRKHKVFDNIWDFTASTHPLRKNSVDETIEQAAKRALREEYQIEGVNLKRVGEFNYFAPYHTVQGNFCENEHDVLLIGEYNGEVKLNPEVGYEYKWILKEDFLKDFNANPDKYTPWTKEAVKILKEKDFF